MHPRYRRRRTRKEKYTLVGKIVRNFGRFFPKGVPALIFNEWQARHERRRNGFGPDKRTTGTIFRQGVPRRGYSETKCLGCHRRFLYPLCTYRLGPPLFCGTRCRDSARLAATYVAYPDWYYLDTVTTELRLWCYTHDSSGRLPSFTVDYVLTDIEVIMNSNLPASQTLNEYFDDRVSLTSQQQHELRRRIGTLLSRQLPRANAQLAGTARKPWTPQQVRLFLGMLNKLVPDMTASLSLSLTKSLDNDDGFDPTSMSRDELEAFLASEMARRTPAAQRQLAPASSATPIFDGEFNVTENNRGRANLDDFNARRRNAKAARTAKAAKAKASEAAGPTETPDPTPDIEDIE